MSSRLLTGLAALGGAVLVSCVPFPENKPPGHGPNKPAGPTLNAQEQQKLDAQREAKKKEEAEKKKQEEALKGEENKKSSPEGSNLPPEKPASPKKQYPYATPAPGRPGIVLSPYNNKEVDVRGFPTNALVQDPTQTSEQKYFRVPAPAP